MQIGNKGLELIKSFEGCKLETYLDVRGIATIGWGHTGPDVYVGLQISQDKADELLRADLDDFEQGVTSLVKVPISQEQFDALISFAYNVGINAFANSLMLRCINKHNQRDAAEQFLRWDKAAGKVYAGLTRRREAERELFLSGLTI